MVQITPSLLTTLLAAVSLTAAAPIVSRQNGAKRVIAWDYTNTQNPAVAPKLNDFNFGSSQTIAVLNWNTWTPEELNDKGRFQPTIRTMAQTTGDDWNFAQTFVQNTPGAHVHTFNEPERNGISAADAANFWNGPLAALRANNREVKLITPAIANTAEGEAWLRDFMGRIGSNPPDFLGLHFYDNVPGNLQGYIEKMHGQHPYPVVMSEVGCIATDGTFESTTRQWADLMDNSDLVYQYAIFGAMTVAPDDGGFYPASNLLLNSDGSFKPLLTDLINKRPMV